MESDLTELSKEELIRHIEILYHNMDVDYKDKCKNYINKDKIKRKIDELKEIADNGANAVRFAMTHDDEIERIQKQKDISTMINILQELLED